MKDWQIIFAVLAGVLFLRFLFRERFQDSPTGVRGPPYNDTDVIKILDLDLSKTNDEAASSDFVKEYRRVINNARNSGDRGAASIEPVNIRTENGRRQIFNLVEPYVLKFYNDVYSPATTPITEEQVRTFVDANLPRTFFPPWLNANQVENIKKLMKKYFVDQPPGPANAPLTEAQIRSANRAQQSGYAAMLAELGQGTAQQSSTAQQTTTATTGVTGTAQQTTTATTGAMGTTQQTTTGTTQQTTTTPGQTTGNINTTTGGSTTSAWGPSGSDTAGGRGFNVFGPVFAGVGEGGNGSATDSTKTNVYPEMLGGRVGPNKTRVDGVGMVNPSVNAPGMNVNLPDFNTLGRSLMPGDQDPYRVSQTFSPSSYSSSVAEPVPFLTDFSAFLK